MCELTLEQNLRLQRMTVSSGRAAARACRLERQARAVFIGADSTYKPRAAAAPKSGLRPIAQILHRPREPGLGDGQKPGKTREIAEILSWSLQVFGLTCSK